MTSMTTTMLLAPPHPRLSRHPLFDLTHYSQPSIVPKLPCFPLKINTHHQRQRLTSPRSVPSSTSPVDDDEQSSPLSGVLAADDPAALTPASGCKACGREEIERGCNGEGRMQGGIATFPGFGWWPIKAYRPCPGFVASGGQYKRQGQSMDEVVSGAAKRTS